LTYFLITLTLLIMFVSIEAQFTLATIGLVLVGAMVMTMVEGIIAGGFDNLAIPILMAVVLQSL